MNDLTLYQQQLPDTINDLAKFVLVGREKLNSVRAEIRAISKVNLANEVLQQKKDEAIMLSNAIIDAETRVGELTRELPKASGGDHGNQYTGGKSDPAATFGKTKEETISDLGFSKKQVGQFEKLAANPDAVEQAKQEAIATGKPVTKKDIILEIGCPRKETRNDVCRQTQHRITPVELGAIVGNSRAAVHGYYLLRCPPCRVQILCPCR